MFYSSRARRATLCQVQIRLDIVTNAELSLAIRHICYGVQKIIHDKLWQKKYGKILYSTLYLGTHVNQNKYTYHTFQEGKYKSIRTIGSLKQGFELSLLSDNRLILDVKMNIQSHAWT